MTHSITIRPAARTLHAIRAEEQIDVVQIRLWNAHLAMALVSEFHCADRVLAEWGRSSGREPVRFEVRFADEHVVHGVHEFFRNGKRRCLLTTHVRRLLSRTHTQAGTLPGAELAQRGQTHSRYLIPR